MPDFGHQDWRLTFVGHWEHNCIGITERYASHPWAGFGPSDQGGERFRLRMSEQGKRAEETKGELVNHPLEKR
jgi:hypothetical protein